MGPDLLMVTTKFEGDYSNHWYLDTSCSNHISGRNEWFIVLNEKVKSKVKFGDNIVVTTEAVDKVMVKRKNGVKAFITNVLYVPKLKNNLLSFRQLAEKGIFYESTLKLNEVRKKLNDRSDSMIFIGYYPIGSYKLYDPKGKMIVIIRDVILDESKWWNWDEGNPKASMKM
ncbi:uncharacterized protein LOC114405064 [Glycine soja]|uniref:uncharacterized protein LOC114405064 n=1 Tax=Glycine soja TaxID=3848 RepID=UPI0003DEBB0D|nr:uncharacterized protein LOC114405064 [Glycine soja]XP_040869858.1 uncharacterized protein LOC121174566 [Glycine max]